MEPFSIEQKDRSSQLEDYLGISLQSTVAESEIGFSSRLSGFWTEMLRKHPTQFEGVFAESVKFEKRNDTLIRHYLVHKNNIDFIANRLKDVGISYLDINREDFFSKYEASSPDWWQIEH